MLLGRKRVEEPDLKLERLEADDLRSRGSRSAEHVLLDAALRLKADLSHAELQHRDGEEPRLEALELREVDAELAQVLLDEEIDLFVDDVCEDRALRQHRRFEDEPLLRRRIDVVDVDLHDDEVGALDERVDRGGKRMVARPHDVHRPEQRDLGAVSARHAPGGRIGGRKTGRQHGREQRDPGPAVHERADTQLTSVSMRPSSWS